MFEFMGSALTGGATGLIGVVLSMVADYFRSRQEFKRQTALTVEARQRDVESVAAATARGDVETAVASMSADGAAYSAGRSGWLVFVDVVRGLTRPIVTIYLCVATTFLYLGTTSDALKLEILQTALYVTTAAVLWWFGTRPGRRA